MPNLEIMWTKVDEAPALATYSLLPIVANTVVGLRRVSHAAVDAARGMGRTNTQVLARLELPLALPVIVTGIRVVLVQNIGMVTVAALIGGGGLGTFVFQGIGQTAIDLVLLGAIPIVALASVLFGYISVRHTRIFFGILTLSLSQVQGLASLWIPPVWAETLVYGLMLLVLVVRPSGLFNRIGEA